MKKALKNLVVIGILAVFLSGCAAGGRGGNSGGSNLSGTGGLVLAGGVIFGALVAYAFTSAKEAEVKEKAIEAHVLLESACKVGPNGSVTYTSSKEVRDAELSTKGTMSPDDCAKLTAARPRPVITQQAQPQQSYRGPYNHYLN